MKVILIAGKARSGKSEASKIIKELLEKFNKKVVITEYSKYIKLFAREFLDWNGISEPKPRKFLQDFGTFIRSNISEDFFVKRMREDIQIYQQKLDVLIISDVRFPTEIDGLRDFMPIVIHVSNDLANYDLTISETLHETEHALDNYHNFDYIIKNKTKEEMQVLLEDILRKEGLYESC